MDLAAFQRQLHGLIKSRHGVSAADEPYIRMVAGSTNLKLMQEIILNWRSLILGQYCYLTTALLKRRNLFDEVLRSFISTQSISPFAEALGESFLGQMSDHEDGLIASVARFELALIRAKKGSTVKQVVDWEYEPYTILDTLLKGLPLDEENAQGSYQTIVAHDIPGLFLVKESEAAG